MCGHVCEAWPLIRALGGTTEEVICDTCTREKYVIADDEPLTVWVVVRKEAEKVSATKKPAKPRTRSVTCFMCKQKGHSYESCPLLTEALV